MGKWRHDEPLAPCPNAQTPGTGFKFHFSFLYLWTNKLVSLIRDDLTWKDRKRQKTYDTMNRRSPVPMFKRSPQTINHVRDSIATSWEPRHRWLPKVRPQKRGRHSEGWRHPQRPYCHIPNIGELIAKEAEAVADLTYIIRADGQLGFLAKR